MFSDRRSSEIFDYFVCFILSPTYLFFDYLSSIIIACVDPPYFDLAYGQLVSSNDTSNQTGQMSYPAGVQFQYRCLLDHYFVGESNITCLPSGFWTDQVTQAGCSGKGNNRITHVQRRPNVSNIMSRLRGFVEVCT